MQIPDFFLDMANRQGWTRLEKATICYDFCGEPQRVVGTMFAQNTNEDDELLLVLPEELVETYEGDTPDECGLLQINRRYVVTIAIMYQEDPDAPAE